MILLDSLAQLSKFELLSLPSRASIQITQLLGILGVSAHRISGLILALPQKLWASKKKSRLPFLFAHLLTRPDYCISTTKYPLAAWGWIFV